MKKRCYQEYDVPDICKSCNNLCSDPINEYDGSVIVYLCSLGLIFPTKNSCKKNTSNYKTNLNT